MSIRRVLVGPESDQGASNQEFAFQKPPVSTIEAVVAIVSQHKEMIPGDTRRTVVIATASSHYGPIRVVLVRLFQRLAVDEDLLTPDFDDLARKADNPLHPEV